jgi:hypothetical protein
LHVARQVGIDWAYKEFRNLVAKCTCGFCKVFLSGFDLLLTLEACVRVSVNDGDIILTVKKTRISPLGCVV